MTPTEIVPTEEAPTETAPTAPAAVAPTEVVSTEVPTEAPVTEAPSAKTAPTEAPPSEPPAAEVTTGVPASITSAEVPTETASEAAAMNPTVSATEARTKKARANTAPAVKWHREFARVIACTRCGSSMDPYLLRDTRENVPQPGWVGAKYAEHRVLIVGQNPGAPNPGTTNPQILKLDKRYTAALRDLRDKPSIRPYRKVAAILKDFIPCWTIRGYFPLEACGLTMDDIAYFNVVRCRTKGNHKPRKVTFDACSEHFIRWIRLLQPRVIVFIGLLVHRHAAALADAEGIPHTYINKDYSLSSEGRRKNLE